MSETTTPADAKAAVGTKGPTLRGYVATWAFLVLMTAVTVSAASLDLGSGAIIAVLAIAAAKSSAVLLYFMRLLWEPRVVIKILVPIVVAALAIFIGLTYTDILYR